MTLQSNLQNLVLKFLMIGDAGVGKTSLVNRLCLDKYNPEVEQTVGVDFMMYKLKVNETEIQLQIWDTAGQENYRALGRAYYRDSVGVMLVFSYDNHNSFTSLEDWIKDAKILCNPNARFMLVGNKTDLTDLREISKTEIDQFVQSHQIEFIETSAKDNINIYEAFYIAARNVLQGIVSNDIKLSTFASDKPILCEKDEQSSKSKCC